MISITSIIFLIIILFAVLFWQSANRARELATQAAKSACDARQLQFLDGTTQQNKLRLVRAQNGLVTIRRQFNFDYYDGRLRLTGKITIQQHEIIEIKFAEPPQTSDRIIDAEPNEAKQSSTPPKSNVIQFPGKAKND